MFNNILIVQTSLQLCEYCREGKAMQFFVVYRIAEHKDLRGVVDRGNEKELVK